MLVGEVVRGRGEVDVAGRMEDSHAFAASIQKRRSFRGARVD